MPAPMSEGEGRTRDRAALQVWRVLAALLALGSLWGLISELNRDEVVGPYGSYGGPDTTSIFLTILFLLAGCAGVWKSSQALASLEDD